MRRVPGIWAAAQHALFAIRNDHRKSRPLEFLRWSPGEITGYLGDSRTDTSS